MKNNGCQLAKNDVPRSTEEHLHQVWTKRNLFEFHVAYGFRVDSLTGYPTLEELKACFDLGGFFCVVVDGQSETLGPQSEQITLSFIVFSTESDALAFQLGSKIEDEAPWNSLDGDVYVVCIKRSDEVNGQHEIEENVESMKICRGVEGKANQD